MWMREACFAHPFELSLGYLSTHSVAPFGVSLQLRAT